MNGKRRPIPQAFIFSSSHGVLQPPLVRRVTKNSLVRRGLSSVAASKGEAEPPTGGIWSEVLPSISPGPQSEGIISNIWNQIFFGHHWLTYEIIKVKFPKRDFKKKKKKKHKHKQTNKQTNKNKNKKSLCYSTLYKNNSRISISSIPHIRQLMPVDQWVQQSCINMMAIGFRESRVLRSTW